MLNKSRSIMSIMIEVYVVQYVVCGYDGEVQVMYQFLSHQHSISLNCFIDF